MGPDDLLPEQTSDDEASAWGDAADETADDERYLREVPPHHGD